MPTSQTVLLSDCGNVFSRHPQVLGSFSLFGPHFTLVFQIPSDKKDRISTLQKLHSPEFRVGSRLEVLLFTM